jgi:hypothetical protein
MEVVYQKTTQNVIHSLPAINLTVLQVRKWLVHDSIMATGNDHGSVSQDDKNSIDRITKTQLTPSIKDKALPE